MKYVSITNYEAAGHDAVKIKIDDWGDFVPSVSVRRDGDSLIVSVEIETRLYMVMRYTGEYWMIYDKVTRPVGYTAEQYVAEHPELTVREIRVREI